MKKLLILSGKGGTGKTTVASCFIKFSDADAIADCDVDAPNLHIINSFKTEVSSEEFVGSKKAKIHNDKCIKCAKCFERCRFNSIIKTDEGFKVKDYACEGCALCTYICPVNAIEMYDDVSGNLKLYKDDEKVFSTAKLKMGRGNSGKLVSRVKADMMKLSADRNLAIIDGSPGTGCPVIASISGVDMILIVAEPSYSGISDLKRLIDTAKIFDPKIAICVNKADLSPRNTEDIKEFANTKEIPYLGEIPYDKAVVKALNMGKSISEYNCPASNAIYDIYEGAMDILFED